MHATTSRICRRPLHRQCDQLLVTDGGLETTHIYHHHRDLPAFAAFVLLEDEAGLATLSSYHQRYIDIARQQQCGFILETPTWRASGDWGAQLGYDAEALVRINRRAVALMLAIREQNSDIEPMLVSGNIGPRGDGYIADRQMSAREAEQFHGEQIATFASTEVDLVTAVTMNYVEEAIGGVSAARARGLPVVIAFTVETDGRLPSGQPLGEAIEQTDASTDGYCAWYMINCAHPTHFEGALPGGASWLQRIGGLRANASSRSHAELDAATELDAGDPADLARRYRELQPSLPGLSVVGGCPTIAMWRRSWRR
jgi:homocysteine S-methyltransferase